MRILFNDSLLFLAALLLLPSCQPTPSPGKSEAKAQLAKLETTPTRKATAAIAPDATLRFDTGSSLRYDLKEFDRTASLQRIKDKINNGQPLVVHLRIPLCDNENQGIVRVSERLGNGLDLRSNLYWGAKYGFKNHFRRYTDWELVRAEKDVNTNVLERVIFKKATTNSKVYVVADAYRGDRMEACLLDYLHSMAGNKNDFIEVSGEEIGIGSAADLLIFNGHNGLMDVAVDLIQSSDNRIREAAVIGCVSHDYFKEHLLAAKGYPVLMTTNLMAPEAYVVEAVIEAWMNLQSPEEIKNAAGRAYHEYQKCGIKGATRLFRHGW